MPDPDPDSDPEASDSARLFERLYDDLKRIAHRQLAGGGATLQTTGLVHEAYLKVVDAAVVDEAHLLNLASRAMRQVLVDLARSRGRDKRGGGIKLETLTERGVPAVAGDDLDVLALEQSLTRLEQAEPRLARVVELHFYGGLSFPEISRVLQVTERTLFRDWRAARAMIHADLVRVAGAGT